MAVELRYPVYIELLTKTKSFLGDMDKALSVILGLSKGYNALIKSAKDFEKAGALGATGTNQLKAVEASALAARRAIIGLAAGFALFESGKMALHATVVDLKEAAKLQMQLHNLSAVGVSAGKVSRTKAFVERNAFAMQGATPASSTKLLTESRTYTGSLKASMALLPLQQRAAFIWALRSGEGMSEGRHFSESLVRGAEPLMRSSQYGKPAYMKRLTAIMEMEEKASALTGINYSPLLRHVATHSGGIATTWSLKALTQTAGTIRAMGNRVGSLAPGLNQVAKLGAGGIPQAMKLLMIHLGMARIGTLSYTQALSQGQPLQLLHGQEAITNPLRWLDSTLVPAIKGFMTTQGVNPSSLRATTEFVQHLGFKHNLANVISVQIARQAQIQNFAEKLKQVPSLTKQVTIAQGTLNGQLLIFHSRLKSLETVLGMPIIKIATGWLSDFVDVLTDFGKLVASNSALADGIAGLLAAFGPLGMILGIRLVYRSFKTLMTTLPELSANIDELTTTLAGLTEASDATTVSQRTLGDTETATAVAAKGASLSFSTLGSALMAGYIGWTLGKLIVNPLINWVTHKLTGDKTLGGFLAKTFNPTSKDMANTAHAVGFVRKDFNPFGLTRDSGKHFRHYSNMSAGIMAMGATLLGSQYAGKGRTSINSIAAEFSKTHGIPFSSVRNALMLRLMPLVGDQPNKSLNLTNSKVLEQLLIGLLRTTGTKKYTDTTEVDQAASQVEGMTASERHDIIHVHGNLHVSTPDAKGLVKKIKTHLAATTTAGGALTARVLTGAH